MTPRPGRPKDAGAVTPLDAAIARSREPLVRRDGGRQFPAGPKALRTRSRLLKAAAARFGAHGYRNTSVADIIEDAGVSFGTFYQYFRDRSDVLAALMAEYVAVVVDQGTPWTAARDPDGLRLLISSFVTTYAASADLSGVWEEACHCDEDTAELRRDLGRVLTGSVERELIKGARLGRCRPFTPRQAAIAARALTAMVDRFCYVTYVFDPPADGPTDPAEAAEVLTALWSDAISLVSPDGS